MYKRIESPIKIQMKNGEHVKPILSLEDDLSGQSVHVINDDHCYVCCLKNRYGSYEHTSYIFTELFNELIKLPPPD